MEPGGEQGAVRVDSSRVLAVEAGGSEHGGYDYSVDERHYRALGAELFAVINRDTGDPMRLSSIYLDRSRA